MTRRDLDSPRGTAGRLTTLLCVAGAFFLAPFAAYAGAQRPCTDPAVFQDAAVNSFVLPYRYVGAKSTEELERASRQISALVHLEVLFSLLKYGAVGGTDLVAVPGQVCDVNDVIAQVSRGSGPGTLRPGQTLVLTWGRLFEEGEQLYVQSYVRFLRQGPKGPVPETVSVPLVSGGTRLDLTAGLPAQAIAFPPRRISKADLARVNEGFRRAMVVRKTRDLNTAGESIDFAPDRPFPYGVTKVEGEWMWIKPMWGGPEGWVKARLGDDANPEEWSLQRWLPELAYIDAISGFMRMRAWDGASSEMAGQLQRSVDSGFRRFEHVVSEEDAPAAYGLERAVRGFVLWGSDQSPEGRADAARRFAETRALMPEYAAARNLAAVTQPLRAESGFNASSAAKLERELVGAIALDPTDAIALSNLERVYAVYAAQPAWSPFAAKELSQRMAIVKAVRAKSPGQQ